MGMKIITIVLVFILFALLTFGLSISLAGAESTYQMCWNDSISYTETVIEYNGGIHTIIENETCDYGCYNGQCYHPFEVPPEIYIAIAFICVALAGIFAYLTIKMRQLGDNILPLMMIVISMIFAIFGVFTLSQVGPTGSLDTISNTLTIGVHVLVVATVFIVFYLILTFIKDVLTKFRDISIRKRKHETGKY